MWRQQVKQRIEAAVEDILCIFEQELMRLQKNEPLSNTSSGVFMPRDQLRTSGLPANDQQKVLSKKGASEERRPDVDQWKPENQHIKDEEPWTGLEGEDINGKKTETTMFPFTAVLLKSEDDEGVRLFSQLHQQQEEGRHLSSSSSADQMIAATGGEDSGKAETTVNPALNTQEDDSSSSETEDSKDDEEDEDEWGPDSQLKNASDSESKTEDSDADCKESKSRKCSKCRKQFLNNVSHHVTSLSIMSPSTCVVKMEDDAEMKNTDSHRKVKTKLNSFSCDSCGKKCRKKATLNTYGTEKHFTCYICGCKFRNENHLDKHMRVHKPFVCDVCGYRFGHKSHLVSHLKIHTGEKPFACNLCELKFTRNTHLNRHMITHTGQKPYPCGGCEKKFTRKEHLSRHVRKQGHNIIIKNNS